jgi:hypothetical protein
VSDSCEHGFDVADPYADDRRRIAAVNAGRCPNCDGPLTDPARSPGGYSHCFRCLVGWRVEPHSLRGEYVVVRRHQPAPPAGRR